MKRPLFALFCLTALCWLFAGCGPQPYWSAGFPSTVGVRVDQRLPADLVIRACNVWSAFGINCYQDDNAETAFVYVVPETEDTSCKDWLGITVLSDAEYRHNTIHIKTNCTEYSFDVAVAHEFGHAWGLMHASEPDALMYYQLQAYKRAPTITDGDVNEFKLAWPDQVVDVKTPFVLKSAK